MNNLTRDLAGTYADVYELAYGRIQVRAKGVALPYTIMRITPAAITENKQHLSAVLTHIKRRTEKATPPPKVKPVSAQRLPQERARTRQTIRMRRSGPIVISLAVQVLGAPGGRFVLRECSE